MHPAGTLAADSPVGIPADILAAGIPAAGIPAADIPVADIPVAGNPVANILVVDHSSVVPDY